MTPPLFGDVYAVFGYGRAPAYVLKGVDRRASLIAKRRNLVIVFAHGTILVLLR